MTASQMTALQTLAAGRFPMKASGHLNSAIVNNLVRAGLVRLVSTPGGLREEITDAGRKALAHD